MAKKLFNYKEICPINIILQEELNPKLKGNVRAHLIHLFTMVLPIKIPNVSEKGISGELICFPKIRKMPTNEINNMIGKVYYKKYASKTGIEKLSNLHQKYVKILLIMNPYFFLLKLHAH